MTKESNRLYRLNILLNILMVSLLVLLFILIIRHINLQDADGELINISGRQRMLSQRIAKSSLVLNDSISDSNLVKSALKRDLEEIESKHDYLIKMTKDEQIVEGLNQLTLQLYALTSSADSLMISDSADRLQHLKTLLQIEPVFLKSMNDLVNLYQAQYDEKQSEFKVFTFVCFFLLLLIGSILYFFVYAPELKRNVEYGEQLQVKNKALREFIFVASHDLQEPLNNVVGFSRLLKRNYKAELGEELSNIVDHIDSSGSRMRALIKGLMDYSRIGEGKTQEWVDCNELVQSIQADLAKTIEQQQAKIVVENDLPKILGYSEDLYTLFFQLIANSIKFRKEALSPVVNISSRSQKNQWLFTIEDNGIGIEEGNYDKIFRMFQRLHGIHKYSGVGVGLSLSKKVVEVHGGRIWIDSSGESGTKICFTLKKI